METKKVIETNVKKLNLTYYAKDTDEVYELKDYADLDDFDEKDKPKMLFEAIQLTLELLVENIQEDLKDLWERLDELENK